MNYLHTYKDFVNEALLPSQYRKYMKHFKKNRYADIFKKYKDAGKEPYGGDRKAYRIYIPLEVSKRYNAVEEDIEKVLDDNGFEIIDYFKGICKRKLAKNQSKIGQILTRLKENELMKKFVEDPERKKGDSKDLMVCISRHPYDIAGSDTDRDWTNCMTLPLSEQQPRMQKLNKQMADLVDAKEKEDNVEKKLKINREIIELDKKISGYRKEGENTNFLKHEVKEGSLVAYLIKKTDKNINNPLSVLNIKPYIGDNEEIYLNACYIDYGTENEDFRDTVASWLKDVNAGKEGHFTLNKKVYPDTDNPEIWTQGKTVAEALADYSQEELDLWTDAHLNEMEITSLEGLEKIKNVKTLHIESNRLTDMRGIEKLENLSALYIADNYFTSLRGIERMKKIKTLDCGDNNITRMNSVAELKNLEHLVCNDNKFTELDVSMLKELQKLQCNDNKLEKLTIGNLEHLTLLDCSKNLLHELDLSGTVELQTLNCANNRLVMIDVEGLNNLTNFSYGHNPWEYPIPGNIIEEFGNQYGKKNRVQFATYESQKAFLTNHPDSYVELLDFDINEKIKKEFTDIDWEEAERIIEEKRKQKEEEERRQNDEGEEGGEDNYVENDMDTLINYFSVDTLLDYLNEEGFYENVINILINDNEGTSEELHAKYDEMSTRQMLDDLGFPEKDAFNNNSFNIEDYLDYDGLNNQYNDEN